MTWIINAMAKYIAVFAFVILHAACGDGSSSSSGADNDCYDCGSIEEYNLVDFGSCTSDREGDTVKLAEVFATYLCKNGSWVDLGEVSLPDSPLSSSSSNAQSSSDAVVVPEKKNDLGPCGTVNNGVIIEYKKAFYICRDSVWGNATTLDLDTYGFNGAEGDVRTGLINKDIYYVYENGTWRATTNEREIAFGACVASREGEIDVLDGSYYICKSDIWETASVLEYDTYGKTCLADGSIVAGEVETANKYVCDAGAFRPAKEQEVLLKKGCVSYTEGNEIRKQLSVVQDSVYLCSSGLWNGTIETLANYMVDSRDGKAYRIVVIGTQTWMAENLNYAYTGIPFNHLGSTSDSTSWCYDNDPENCEKYGRLYTWAAAMDSVGTWSENGKGCGYDTTCSPTLPVRGICPEGWHLPDTTDRRILHDGIGGRLTAGIVLKSQTGWNGYKDASGNGTDAFGFSALPAGRRGSNGNFLNEGDRAFFWSSTEVGNIRACYMSLGNYFDDGYLGEDIKNEGFSVRCVKD